jgi:hypothetical protein
MRRGVYATSAALAWAKRDAKFVHAVQVAAAWAGTGRNSVASHQSAALMHGISLLRRPPPAQVTLTRPPGLRAGRPSGDGIVFHAAELRKSHVTRLHTVPVTTVARTVADLARTTSFMAGVASADNALYRNKTTKAAVTKVLTVCKQWPGVERARQVVEFADGRAESVLESCARVVFAEHGLPAPDLQVDLGGERYVGRVDFLWPAYCTVAEVDGALKYEDNGRARAVEQLERDQLLRAAGFRVVHITWQQLFYEQQKVIRWIRPAAAAPPAGRPPPPCKPGLLQRLARDQLRFPACQQPAADRGYQRQPDQQQQHIGKRHVAKRRREAAMRPGKSRDHGSGHAKD